jgi:VRR-NUC domain
MLESDIQELVIDYIKLKYPSVLYCASAGGMRTSMRQAIKMKRTGYRKGFPDLQIMHPTILHHGLFIEIKTLKGQASPEQKEWRDQLNERGYKAVICKGLDACLKAIDDYMNETT